MSYVFPVLSGRISSGFGDSRDGGARSHAGVDVAVPVGTSVFSMAPGRVSFTGYNSARGNYLKIDNNDGTMSLYEHLSSFAARVGDSVGAGDLIAYSGNTGQGTGPHLHFELWRNGSPVDPMGEQYSKNAHNGGGRSFGGSAAGSVVDSVIDSIKNHWVIIAAAFVIVLLLSRR